MNVIIQLRQARQARGLSIARLADRMGISPAALGSWERSVDGRNGRNPALPQIEAWAAHLGMRPVLVPDDDIDYAALASVIGALATIADTAPTVADIAEGIRIAREEAVVRYASVANCPAVAVAA